MASRGLWQLKIASRGIWQFQNTLQRGQRPLAKQDGFQRSLVT